MAISISNNDPTVSYTIASGQSQTAFAVPFAFFDDVDLDVLVDDILKTITVDYTVSGGDGTTGTVTFTSAVNGPATVVINRDTIIQRSTDFPISGPFNISSLNDDLDKQILIQAELDKRLDKAVKIPFGEITTTELPAASSRGNTIMSFDGNGNVTTIPISTSTTETTLTKENFTGNGSQTVFTLTSAPGGAGNGLMIFIDGVYQERGVANYTISGNDIAFLEAPPLNSTIQVLNFSLKELAIITTEASGISQNHANSGSTPFARRLGGDVQSALEFIYDNVFEPAKVTFTSIYPFKIEPTNGGTLLIDTDNPGVSNNSVRVDLKTGLTNAFNFRQSGDIYLRFNTASQRVDLDKPLYVNNGATFATGGVTFASGVSVGMQDVLSVTGRTAFSGDTVARGDGFTAAGSLHKTSIMRHGDIIITRIFVDITDLQSGAAGNTIIGGFGLANCHIGSVSSAVSGTIFYSTIRCVESATGGDTNIDLYESSDGTQSQAAVITGSSLNTSLTAVAGNSAITGNPTANNFLYLVGAGSTSTAYNSGQFLIEMYGYA